MDIKDHLPTTEYVCPFCGARLVDGECPNDCQDRIITSEVDNGED